MRQCSRKTYNVARWVVMCAGKREFVALLREAQQQRRQSQQLAARCSCRKQHWVSSTVQQIQLLQQCCPRRGTVQCRLLRRRCLLLQLAQLQQLLQQPAQVVSSILCWCDRGALQQQLQQRWQLLLQALTMRQTAMSRGWRRRRYISLQQQQRHLMPWMSFIQVAVRMKVRGFQAVTVT